MSALNIFEKVQFDERIIKEDYHTYQPRLENFGYNDEIRIAIQHQDVCTLPSESFLKITGKISASTTTAQPENVVKSLHQVNNAYAFLFDEIRYELNGIEVDKIRDVGITTTLKGYLSFTDDDFRTLETGGWCKNSKPISLLPKLFAAHIPLKCLLGFAEDYKKIMINVKQELILLRSRNDDDLFKNAKATVEILKIEWHVPHVHLNDEIKLYLFNQIKLDKPILIPFRKWELHELPALRTTERDIWTVKTSTALERPRFIIIAFQTNRRDKVDKDVTYFDHCNIRNIKIYLNSESYPYDNLNLDINNDDYSLIFDMYNKFRLAYYGDNVNAPSLTYNDFKNHMIYTFDVSKQNESLKSSAIDLKIEMESNTPFPDKTRGYCLILCDNIVEYTPLSGLVRKLLQ